MMLRLLILSRKGKMIELPRENKPTEKMTEMNLWLNTPSQIFNIIIHGKLLQQVKTKEFWDHVPQVHFDPKKKNQGKIQHIPPLNWKMGTEYNKINPSWWQKQRIWREAGGKVHKSLKSKRLWAVFQKWRDILLKLQHRS